MFGHSSSWLKSSWCELGLGIGIRIALGVGLVLGLGLGAGLGLGIGMAEELLVRGELAPGLAHARRAVEALLEAGVPQNLDQQLDIQAVEESCALRNANAPHRSRP